MRKVLILGGYGNFGKRIALALIKNAIPVIIAGRDHEKAKRFARSLTSFATASLVTPVATSACFDVTHEFALQLAQLRPSVVINTCGPFQTANYDIARTCIDQGVHYIDLADGRDFVTGIDALNTSALQNNVSVISGASTVPGLSSAVIEHFRHEFSVIDSLVYGISPGQQAERGLATTQAIMSYVGKPLKPFAGNTKPVYGWQTLYRQTYPGLGKRWMANCDIPDLDLLPARYGLRSIQFSAGLELSALHLGLWLLSWVQRLGLSLNLNRYAAPLLKISDAFNGLGTSDGGMHLILRGQHKNGSAYERQWFIIAKGGDGPHIPCIPSIILAKKLVLGEQLPIGAYPCVGLVSLEEYLAELKEFKIETLSFNSRLE